MPKVRVELAQKRNLFHRELVGSAQERKISRNGGCERIERRFGYQQPVRVRVVQEMQYGGGRISVRNREGLESTQSEKIRRG
jgi:hypothetical protein